MLNREDKIQFKGYVKSNLDGYLQNRNLSKKNMSKEFYEHLLSNVYSHSIKTILILFFAFKKENLLKGDSSEDRYNYFDSYSSTGEFHELVNRMYPLLKLRIDKALNNHILNYFSLKERAEEDKTEIYDSFGFVMEGIDSCHVEYGASDYHRGLNSICIIENENKSIIYKPRAGSIDEYWGNMIDWFNSKEPSLKLDIIKVLDKGEYHWQEYVHNKACDSEEEIKRLYYRVGILSALSYVFKVSDLHMENIIVSGEHPYIVDLETIFQLDGFKDDNAEIKSATDVINMKVRKSVLGTQLFPSSSKFYDSNIDISGITGKGGQVIKNGKVEIINGFTDEMELIRRDGISQSKGNIGRIGDKYVNPKDYLNDIVEGFKEGYTLIKDNSEELLKLINSGELFKDISPRYLFRNTNLYSIILDKSKNPNYLKDKAELTRLYHLLFRKDVTENMEKVYESEVEDLFNDDIPYFYGNINDKTIYNSKGEGCFKLSRTPLLQVIARIEDLNQADLDTQIDFIQRSMANHKKTWNRVRDKKAFREFEDGEYNHNGFVEAAKDIANLLIDKAEIHKDTGTINWLDLQNSFPTWTMKAQDIYLYNGLAGNAIFFSSLFQATKDVKYKDILGKILMTIKTEVERTNKNPISVFNGVISLAYLYAFLYNQTKDKTMLQQSIDIIEANKAKILTNPSYDIIDGLSGILIVVLNIFKLSNSSELENLSIKIGKEIIENIQIEKETAYWKKGNKKEQMIAGFSHGIAGVCYGLGELYKNTKYKEHSDLIDRLIKIENSYYSNTIENWIDLRSEHVLSTDSSPIHWCHGAVGIGLSRLKNKEILDTSNDIDKAVELLIKNGLYRDSDCLCHGNLGNLDLLIAAYKECRDIDLYKTAINRANEIISESKNGTGYINGIGQEFHSPSFMLGLSGIGYELLRLSDPDRYPSVLLLEV